MVKAMAASVAKTIPKHTRSMFSVFSSNCSHVRDSKLRGCQTWTSCQAKKGDAYVYVIWTSAYSSLSRRMKHGSRTAYNTS
jgi:hypothetical protein